jgi:hypothetical protein
MLIIVEAIYDEPIRMLAKPGVQFKPGWAVRTIDAEDGTLMCDLASDSTWAIGIAGNECYVEKPSYRLKDMVEVWSQKMIFRCDQYEEDTKFSPGCPLYISENGKFTSEPDYEEAPCVAHVTMVPDVKHEYFEANWL